MTFFDIVYPMAAFLLGSVPWSWIIGRTRGRDIRKSGSGNTGATNLFRTCGRGAGISGLVLDAMKGAVPVLAASRGVAGLAPPAGEWTVAVSAVCAVLGHVFSPWLGFRGGKGVATTLGVLLVLSPLSVLTGILVFTVMLFATRFVSLGSITAAVAVIPSVFIFNPDSLPVQLIVCLVAALILVRHRSNMVKLLRGEENRFHFRGGGNG